MSQMADLPNQVAHSSEWSPSHRFFAIPFPVDNLGHIARIMQVIEPTHRNTVDT